MAATESYLHKLGASIEYAAERLPDDWQIELHIEKDSGSASLFNPDGDEVQYPSNHESLADAIQDAVECAIETASS